MVILWKTLESSVSAQKNTYWVIIDVQEVNRGKSKETQEVWFNFVSCNELLALLLTQPVERCFRSGEVWNVPQCQVTHSRSSHTCSLPPQFAWFTLSCLSNVGWHVTSSETCPNFFKHLRRPVLHSALTLWSIYFSCNFCKNLYTMHLHKYKCVCVYSRIYCLYDPTHLITNCVQCLIPLLVSCKFWQHLINKGVNEGSTWTSICHMDEFFKTLMMIKQQSFWECGLFFSLEHIILFGDYSKGRYHYL